MRGPSLIWSLSFSTQDTEPPLSPDDQITLFSDEILAAIPLEDFERLEEAGAIDQFRRDAEIVALYLVRSWHFDSAWWADAGLRKIFDDKLPATKAIALAHANGFALRLSGKGQSKREYLRQYWDDQTFFQVAAMRGAGVSAHEASHQAARWRDEITDGSFTTKASTVEKEYPKWAKSSLRGKVSCDQLSQVMECLTPSEKVDLIQSNALRVALMPPLANGLQGERR